MSRHVNQFRWIMPIVAACIIAMPAAAQQGRVFTNVDYDHALQVSGGGGGGGGGRGGAAAGPGTVAPHWLAGASGKFWYRNVDGDVSTFYLVSQKELFPKTWYKTFLYVPFLMALGVGLTITNTKAVMEALFGIKSAFARTPKYRVKKKGEASQAKVYRKRLGIVPWIELAIGTYFAWTVYYAVTTENFFTV